MATPINDRRTELVASAAQTTFTYDFAIEDDGSLIVTHIPVATGISATLTQEFTGTPATGEYFVTAGFPTVKTIVVLGSDILVSDEIVIEGDTDAKRTTDFPDGGDFFAETVNAEHDNEIDMIQEITTRQSRSVSLNPGFTSSFDMTLPDTLTPLGILAINAAGNGFSISPASVIGVSSTDVLADTAVVVGDGGSRNVKDTGVLINGSDDITGVNSIDIGSSIAITGMLDEDDLVSDSATQVATQQSIKAFVADTIGAIATALFSGRVDESGGIVKGQVVFTSGATGNQMTVSLADNSNFAEVNAIAVAFNDASNNATIQLISSGLLTDLDTTSLAEGATLYLGTAGVIVDEHPSGIDAVILIGTCVRSHASLGQIFIKIQASTDVHDFDGVARNQIVNTNTGTSAVASHSFINDANHRASISITSVANTQGSEHFSLFSDGYGNFNFLQNGNHPFRWLSDSGDTHNPLNLVEVMELLASGELSVSEIWIGSSGAETIDGSADNLRIGTTLGSNGLSIFAGTTSSSSIDFRDGGATLGRIRYGHTSDTLNITTAGTIALTIDNVQQADFSGIISGNDTTDSTSGTSGSFHTDGGVGIVKKLFVAGESTFDGGIAQESFTAVTYDTNWADLGGFQGVEFMKDSSGRVHIRGTAVNTVDTGAVNMFTLPVGYRPPARLLQMTLGNTALAHIDFQTSGIVRVASGVYSVNISVNFSFAT